MTLALPSAVFDQQTAVRVLQNSPTRNVRDAFYTVKGIKAFNGKIDNKSELCDLANEELKSANNIESVYYATFVTETLECAKRANEKVAALVFNTPKETSIEKIFYGTKTAFLLKKAKHLSFDNSMFTPVIETVFDLAAIDGTVKNQKSDARGTLYHSGLAFDIFNTIREFGAAGDDSDLAFSVFKENIESLLELYRETDDGLIYIDNNDMRSGLKTTDTFLTNAMNLVDDDEFEVFTEAVCFFF